MTDKEVDDVQKLKALECELHDLRLDARNVEKKISGRIERIKSLESETEKAKVKLMNLYVNLREFNNLIEDKMKDMKDILDIRTGNYFETTL